MTKLKCIKCGTRYKDRKDPAETATIHRQLCWNCRFIWTVIGLTLKSFDHNPFMGKQLNRSVEISLDNVIIKKRSSLN